MTSGPGGYVDPRSVHAYPQRTQLARGKAGTRRRPEYSLQEAVEEPGFHSPLSCRRSLFDTDINVNLELDPAHAGGSWLPNGLFDKGALDVGGREERCSQGFDRLRLAPSVGDRS